MIEEYCIVNMDFNPNKTQIECNSIEIIKEGGFAGTYVRDVYSNINKKWYKNSLKEFIHLRNIDPKFYASDYYDKRQINRWKKIVSRFRGKLVKIIKNPGGKYDDYSISPKIRQILLHWGYELTKKDFELSS